MDKETHDTQLHQHAHSLSPLINMVDLVLESSLTLCGSESPSLMTPTTTAWGLAGSGGAEVTGVGKDTGTSLPSLSLLLLSLLSWSLLLLIILILLWLFSPSSPSWPASPVIFLARFSSIFCFFFRFSSSVIIHSFFMPMSKHFLRRHFWQNLLVTWSTWHSPWKGQLNSCRMTPKSRQGK